MKKDFSFNLSFATFDDVNKIEQFLYSYFEESMYSCLTYDPLITRQTIMQWIPETCILAKVDDKIAGIVAAYFTRTYYKEIEGDVVIFYVHPDYRGTPIARSLVNALTMIADKNSAAIVYTSSGSGIGSQNNKLYGNLFKKFGFQELGTELIRKNV